MQTLQGQTGCRQEWDHIKRGLSEGIKAPETAAAPSDRRGVWLICGGVAGLRLGQAGPDCYRTHGTQLDPQCDLSKNITDCINCVLYR